MLYLKDLITKETPIIKVANDSSVTEIEKTKILGTNNATYSLSRREDYFKMMYKMNNIWYYFKVEKENRAYPFYLIDELMGNFLAKKIEISSVSYLIGSRKQKKNKYQFGLVSKNFKEPEFEYCFCDCYQELWFLNSKNHYDFENSRNIENLKMICKSEKETHRLIQQILKMLALDLFMLQKDRNNSNIQFQINKKTQQIELAPLYDFSNCISKIEKEGIYLKNYILRLTEKTMKDLLLKYPIFQSYLSYLLEIGFTNSWKEICTNYAFNQNSLAYEEILKYYQEKEKSQRKNLSLYLKK